MARSPGELTQSYFATFRVNGEEWPISGTAVVSNHTVKAAYRELVTGDPFRVVTVPSVNGITRAVKHQMIRVTFDLITFDWVKKLQNLQDANQPFDMRLLAFDSRTDEGVAMRSLTVPNTSIAPPFLSLDPAFTQVTNGTGTLSPSGYSYRVSALIGTSETLLSDPLGVTVIAPNNTITLNWRHIAGVTTYKVYGRTPGAERFMKVVTPAGGTAAGTFITYVDTNVDAPGNDGSSLYTKYVVSGERRWAADLSLISILKNRSPIASLTVLDHNGNSIQAGSGAVTVNTATGMVQFTTPNLPSDEIRAVYVWEPQVALDDLDPNPMPSNFITGSLGTPTGAGPVYGNPSSPNYGVPNGAGWGNPSTTTYGVLYSPTMTLYEVN